MKNRTVYIVESSSGEYKIFSSHQRAIVEAFKVYSQLINDDCKPYSIDRYARDLEDLITTSRIEGIVYIFEANFEDAETN